MSKKTAPKESTITISFWEEDTSPFTETADDLRSMLDKLNKWDGKAESCPPERFFKALERVIILAARKYRKIKTFLLLHEAITSLDRRRAALWVSDSIKDAEKRVFEHRPTPPLIEKPLSLGAIRNTKETIAMITPLTSKPQDILDISSWCKFLTPGTKQADLQEALRLALEEDKSALFGWGLRVDPFIYFLMQSGVSGRGAIDMDEKTEHNNKGARDRKRRQRGREKIAKLAKPKSG